MQLIASSEQVFQLIQGVKEKSKRYTTNFFIDSDRLNALVAMRQMFYIAASGGVLFFRQDASFYHVYYCTESEEHLSTLLSESLPREILVADVIGKVADANRISNVFSERKFTSHASLDRYTRINKEGVDHYGLSEEVEEAGAGDEHSIANMLRANFDKYADQIYQLHDVISLVAAKKIILIREATVIKGFLVRNILPQSSVLNNFLVNPQFRGEKIGSKLLKHYIFESRNAKRMWLWVLRSNDNAINLYKRHGYSNDGLADNVMILNNTEHG